MKFAQQINLTPKPQFNRTSKAGFLAGLMICLLSPLLGCKSSPANTSETPSSESARMTASADAWKTPRQIILVRHGEKIDDVNPGLSPEGCERAFQLPAFFSSLSAHVVGIFAQQPNKPGSSLRPLETIAPTASALHLKINNSFRRYEIEAVAQELLTNPIYWGNTVIVSWEHSMIPQLAQKLGVSLPPKLGVWPGGVFDQAWVLNYPGSDLSAPTLTIVAEHVLPTDISNEQSGIENWGNAEPHQVDPNIQIPNSVLTDCRRGNQSLDELVRQTAQQAVPGL